MCAIKEYVESVRRSVHTLRMLGYLYEVNTRIIMYFKIIILVNMDLNVLGCSPWRAMVGSLSFWPILDHSREIFYPLGRL